MTKTELLFQISNIVNGHLSFSQAMESIRLLLQREAPGKALIIEGHRQTHRSKRAFQPMDLLDPVNLRMPARRYQIARSTAPIALRRWSDPSLATLRAARKGHNAGGKSG